MKHPDPVEVQVARRLEGGWTANTGEQPVDHDQAVITLWGDGVELSAADAGFYDWSIPYRTTFDGEPDWPDTILYWKPAT